MAKLKLGELIDRTLTIREQARILARMRDTLRAESRRAQAKAREQQARTRARTRAPASASTPEQARRAAQQRRTRLLATLQTSVDPAALQRAREALARDVETDASERDARTGAQQHRDTAPETLLAHHAPGRAAFWRQLGPAPHCQPGDTATAMVFYRKVQRALDAGGWTHRERAALLDLAAKWGPRALGTDPRFMIVGTLPGRLPAALEAKIRALKVVPQP